MARLASLVLLGAAVASAHPNHAHNLAHKHRAVAPRAIGDKICTEIYGEEACWKQESNYWDPSASSAAAPATTPMAVNVNVNAAVHTTLATSTKTSSAAYAASTPASSGSTSTTATTTTTDGYTVDVYTDFADITCMGDKKRATLAEILQVGNTGGSCYGSNMLVITDAEVAAKYDNYVRFYNAPEDMTCAYWNKASKTGAINGWYKDMDSYFTFDLPAAGTVYLAADAGTAGAASCFPASTGIEWDSYGAIGGTWLEFTFVDVTTGYSGWDASCIIAEDGDLTINALEVCADDGTQCSSIGAGLSSISKAFNSALAAADGLGGQCDGSVKLAGNFGF